MKNIIDKLKMGKEGILCTFSAKNIAPNVHKKAKNKIWWTFSAKHKKASI